MDIELKWDKGQEKQHREKLKAAQDYVDSECLRLMTPYVPVGLKRYRNSGALRNSGRVQSPGVIVFTNQWAHSNYYNLQKRNFKRGGNPNATPLWFETMKKKHGQAILRGAAALIGSKTKG